MKAVHAAWILLWTTGTQAQDTCPCNDSPIKESILIQRCDPSNATFCEEHCNKHSSDYLADKCCIHAGKSASLLAFEEDSKWIDRLEEFNKCTGATVRLEYLPEGEDGMADALRRDVGDDTAQATSGEGIFDAYIVQAPWLPPVVEGLANLSPLIRQNADIVDFLDINPASRSAVSFNGTVRALPLDTDYVAIGWRHDVFVKHGIEPVAPKTIEELADLSERLNGLDHNGDGEPDWGVCLTPQVNYFYAFAAPVLQTQLRDEDTGAKTGQNIFFDSETFEPLIRVPGFRYALEQYWRVIRSSNCQDQLPKGEKCDRKTAFPTGRCAMVISMPGTLTSMILESGKRKPQDRLDESGNVVWSVSEQPLGPGGSYWGRRAPFPGSKLVQTWDREEGRELVECQGAIRPLADDEGVNFAPFFAEGGEAYALNGRQSKPTAQTVMWNLFTWLADLPVPQLPLSGQYRKSHLNDESREELKQSGWPQQMIDDLFALLDQYFKSEDDGGNPAQDLLMLGFPDYMGALDEELHDKLLGVFPTSEGGLFDSSNPSNSVDPKKDADVFNVAFDDFVDALEERYAVVSKTASGGALAQLQRWRQSLNLPWKTNEEICSTTISIDVKAFRQLECARVVNMETLCQTQPDDVAAYDETLCDQFYGNSTSVTTIIVAVVSTTLLILLLVVVYVRRKNAKDDSVWQVKSSELTFPDPPKVLGAGAFGLVLLAEYRGTKVAVKQALPPSSGGSTQAKKEQPLTSSWGGIELGKPSRKMSGLRSTKMASLGLTMKSDASRLKEDFVTEMRLISKLRHPCITTVMGAVIENEKTMLIMEHMELGSLHDVLHNNTMALDGDLVLPILQEVAQGVRFLHSSHPPIVHGDLKAKNVLVDSKFRAKVADFGLTQNRSQGATGTPFWMAPELLSNESKNTIASDVYSFGVMLYEVYERSDPYEGEDPFKVLKAVADPHIKRRPPVPAACPQRVSELMTECFSHDPQSRPTFEEVDLLLQRLSTESVEPGEMQLSLQARKDLKASRANKLLNDVFPPHVAEALRDGRKVEQEQHECVTIFFSDIVGFTTLSQTMTPEKVCDMLDRLYFSFDELSMKHEIFKIETIGDAYMAITNLVKNQKKDHAKRCAMFAIEALQAAQDTMIDVDDPSKGRVQIRVGFHSGPVISDVVGKRLPKFAVFGDTVNTASRMESNSLPGCIHCSELSANLLRKQAPEMDIHPRGKIEVKGKGEMATFWVDKTPEKVQLRVDLENGDGAFFL